MRHAILLCHDVLADPTPGVSIKQAGVLEVVYGVNFFVPDSSSLGPAKSSLLRQTRRFFHHAGIGSTGPIGPTALLASLVLFEALTPAEVEQLATRLVTHTVEPGDVLFEQGSAGSSIYVVQSGVLELVRHSLPATGQVLGRIGPGEYIGELGLVAGAPRGVTMTALTSAQVLELPGDSLTELLGSNAALKAAMEKSIRKGFANLQRDEAARSADQEQQTPALFARIRAFFGV